MWHGIDKLAERNYSISPYVYCNNNPINQIDILGLSTAYVSMRNYGFNIYSIYGGSDGGDGQKTLGGGSGSSFPKMCGGFGQPSTLDTFVAMYALMMECNLGVSIMPDSERNKYVKTLYRSNIRNLNGRQITRTTKHAWIEVGGFWSDQGYVNIYNLEDANNTSMSGQCPNCLDPSTTKHNIFWLTYPGGDNPKTYFKDFCYSYVPSNFSEYPAIGHDRRYDNLNIEGKKGLFTDTRAIGADWRFVVEELCVASIPYFDPISRIEAGILGVGMGLCIIPKTLYKLSQTNGFSSIMLWYSISNVGVTNAPSIHMH